MHSEADEGPGPWPAFADLLGATTLLFLILFAAVAIPALKRSGEADARESSLNAIEHRLRQAGTRDGVRVLRVGDYLLVRIEGDATFPTDRYELGQLKPEGKRILKAFGAFLRSDSVLREIDQIQVVGHTSREGTEERNWILSSSRAATVALFLIDSARIEPCKVSALGRSRYYPVDPAAARASARVDQQDRRIELEIRPVLPTDTVQKARRASCVGPRAGA
ncbi:MAG TPA: OmpA family protein [Longimicrobium sp.]|jgi:outer membrane protein OmpA-like peptidoglycan-associated protein